MSKKRKNAKQRLNILLMLLLLTTILMIMSTYAWFTANKQVNIDGIDLNVATTNGLQISADGSNWKTVLTIDDLLNAQNTGYTKAVNQLPKTIAPTSSNGACTAGKMDMYYGTVYAEVKDPHSPNYGKYMLTAAKQTDQHTVKQDAAGNGYYSAFDIFIKNGSRTDTFFIGGQVNELTGDALNKIVQTDPTYERGITNSARVGILMGGNTTSENVDDIRGLTTQPQDGKAIIWEPNYQSHKTEAINNFNTMLKWPGFSVAESAETRTDALKSNIDPLSAVPLDKAYVEEKTHGKFFETVTPQLRSPKNTNGPVTPMDVQKPLEGGVTKFRLYLWIEGQDVDCENHAANSDLRFDVNFSIN